MLTRFDAKRCSISACLCLIFALSVMACGGSRSGGGNGGTTARVGGTDTSSTTLIHLGVQACPAVVKDPAYWDAIIGTQSGVSKVARVNCANLVGQPALQALILVAYQGTGQMADVYVYTDITKPSPMQLFKLQGLYRGDARIGGYNTVITSEVDQASSLNKGQLGGRQTPDLFREFKWSGGAGTFVPVTFPGIFPDPTRYQAEVAQQEVNAGHQPWRLSAIQTSQKLVANLLRWGSNAPAVLVSGGGSHDVNAVVSVKSTSPGSSTLTVGLSRLEGNGNGGIWEATSVNSPGMTITDPRNRDRLSSPTIVSGSGSPFKGVSGQVIILDHLYTDIGHTAVIVTSGGKAAFSTNVSYTSTFKTGTQEGVLALYAYSSASRAIAGAVMLKEMLS